MYQLIQWLLGNPVQNENRHAARTFFVVVFGTTSAVVGGVFAKPLVGYPVSRWGYPLSYYSIFMGISLMGVVALSIMAICTFGGSMLGGFLDRRTSPRWQHILYYCTRIWILGISLLGVAWSIHGIFEGGHLPAVEYFMSDAVLAFASLMCFEPIRKRVLPI